MQSDGGVIFLESGGEWNSGGHCRESTLPLDDTRVRPVPEMNVVLEQVVQQMKIPVTILNITNLSGLRIDGHPSVYGRKAVGLTASSIQDCSHGCLPGLPDTWNELGGLSSTVSVSVPPTCRILSTGQSLFRSFHRDVRVPRGEACRCGRCGVGASLRTSAGQKGERDLLVLLSQKKDKPSRRRRSGAVVRGILGVVAPFVASFLFSFVVGLAGLALGGLSSTASVSVPSTCCILSTGQSLFRSFHSLIELTDLCTIVDSVIALFRVDFSGRGELAEHQKKLAQMLSRLTKIAEEFNVAVYITNQVIADSGDGFITDPKKPAGGHVLAHAATIWLMLRKGKGEQRKPNCSETD
ncbi:hypothetical protein ABZP36_035429 [Zizania latifolia]